MVEEEVDGSEGRTLPTVAFSRFRRGSLPTLSILVSRPLLGLSPL